MLGSTRTKLLASFSHLVLQAVKIVGSTEREVGLSPNRLLKWHLAASG